MAQVKEEFRKRVLPSKGSYSTAASDGPRKRNSDNLGNVHSVDVTETVHLLWCF